MHKIAMFHKVSYHQFSEDAKQIFSELSDEQIKNIYDNITLPKRATQGSAGYDFFTPVDIALAPGKTLKLPTGIRVEMQDGWVLTMHPRSSLGFKYRLQLDNTTGIIDADYFGSDNEGHIFVKLTNDTKEEKCVQLVRGEAMVQGIFLPFGICEDDDVCTKRNGGFGSTNTSM